MRKILYVVCIGFWLTGLWYGAAARAAQTAALPEELLAALPEADVVAVIDAQRAFTELLPKLKTIATGGIGRTATEIETLARLSGVEPKQIQAAVLAVRITESLTRGSGVLLLQGVEIDVKKLGEAANAQGDELKTAEYNGRTLYSLSLKPAANAQPLELHFALLGGQRLALGDPSGVMAALDGGAKSAQQAAFIKSLRETKATGLVRFAGNLPGSLRSMLADQGELFAQVAAVKTIFGFFELNADNSATLEARLRTNSSAEAGQLKDSLNGLVALGKSFLGGSDSANLQAIGKLLDQIKLGVQAGDVSLLLPLSKEVMEQLSK